MTDTLVGGTGPVFSAASGSLPPRVPWLKSGPMPLLASWPSSLSPL